MRYKDAQEDGGGGKGVAGIFAGACMLSLGKTASVFNPITMGTFLLASIKWLGALIVLGGGIAVFPCIGWSWCWEL